MAQNLFAWNGVHYDVAIISLRRTFDKLSSDKSGRTQDGHMFIDPIGTFYNYELVVRRAPTCSLEEYDNFFDAISAPAAFGNLKVPYNQGAYYFDAYITNGAQELIKRESGHSYWGDITLQFIAKSPQRTV